MSFGVKDISVGESVRYLAYACMHVTMTDGLRPLALQYISPLTLYKQRSLNAIKQGYILHVLLQLGVLPCP